MNRFSAPRLSRGPMRLLVATGTLALAAAAMQPAQAMPGMHDGPGMHGDRMGMMKGGAMGERMLDAVNATPEQRAQIRQIMDAARKDLRAQHEGGRALHEQAAQIFAQPNVDARAAETLRQQMVARHDAASKRMMQAMLDASRVLTPEQRKTLAERMAQRRSMMERHRSERESLEGGAARR